jgi:FKBP-type peptidyl-prolyl cis-trans isomerase
VTSSTQASVRVDLANHDPGGKLRAMRAPCSLVSLLVLTMSATACERASAPAAPAAASAPDAAMASTAPVLSGAGWITPPPADVSAPPADAEREPNGVVRKILARGKGTVRATAQSYADLRYAGWERNGKQFEGTDADGTPRRYDIKELAPGLTAELTQMVEGDKRRLWLPGALAYANRPNFANAPRGDMTFEIELVHVIQLPPVPENVAAAPKEAKTTKSGLAYLVLKKGTGKHHPTDDTRANVIYTAWKPNGDMFQTSLIGGDVSAVRVKRLPPGWREAMVHMVEGDKWRLWLPGKLAFGELQPGQEALPFGPPPGPVVFDVELIKILE